jgi:hypothetical protein
LNLRKATGSGARNPLTARPTNTVNRPRDRYPEVSTSFHLHRRLHRFFRPGSRRARSLTVGLSRHVTRMQQSTLVNSASEFR